jgi:hypothetical protein
MLRLCDCKGKADAMSRREEDQAREDNINDETLLFEERFVVKYQEI